MINQKKNVSFLVDASQPTWLKKWWTAITLVISVVVFFGIRFGLWLLAGSPASPKDVAW